uniref:CCHC-type domain-containing protein n=1 Tax=Plectus sambesii TaxID=2011161 RepID=A0A914WHB1_9BILA
MLLMLLPTSVFQTLIARCHQRNVYTKVEYDELMMTLERHYLTKPIQLGKYHRLFSLQQQSGQSTNDFASQIGQVTRRCKFPIDLPRAQAIVFAMGYRDDKVRSELIQRDHMSMEAALEHARQLEGVLKETSRSNRPSNLTELSSVNQVCKSGAATTTSTPCHRCGKTGHKGDACRFKDKTCHCCGKRGHISSVCRSASKQQQKQLKQQQSTQKRKKETQQQNSHNKLSVDFVKIAQTAGQTTPGQYFSTLCGLS